MPWYISGREDIMTLEEAINSKRETEAQNRKREEEWMQEERL